MGWGPPDLALKGPELMAQGQDFGTEPGIGPATDDQGFQQDTYDNVEEGEKYDRGSIAGTPCPGTNPRRQLKGRAGPGSASSLGVDSG